MRNTVKIFFGIYFLMCSFFTKAQDTTLIPFGSEWKYLDTGSDQGSAWRATAFNDGNWSSGFAEFGYGDGDEITVIDFGTDPDDRHITTYFRHTFEIQDLSDYANFLVKLIRDDGAFIYVNGEEVMRSNFRTDTYTFDDVAESSVPSAVEEIIFQEIIPTSFFQNGTNVIAVEIHQSSPSSNDLSFDFELIGLDTVPALYREPYLQLATPTSIVIKWATDVPTKSRVKYGNAPGSLIEIVDLSDLTMNHEVTVDNLQPDTKYYYSIGTDTQELAGGEESYFFNTNPQAGTANPTRIWVIGDSGRATQKQKDVRDSYLNYTGEEKADLWLMLGDNAYYHGRDAEYHVGLFKNMYESILRNTVLWPIAGNHDYYSGADAAAQTGVYYENFALPANGEAGGVPSGTEAYYSFDYGNIHFIGLDSYDTDRDSAEAMGQWLKEDLEHTTADWLIAYWHYPPYTKGNHDSDESTKCIEMRENFNPILERYGVDLVLSGHSHVYERTYFIDGHYDVSSTLDTSMIIDGSSGKLDLLEAYTKPKNLASHAGTVYTVCGVGGLTSDLADTHPAMYLATDEHLGSMIIDISGDTLKAKFLNSEGSIIDYFDIIKKSTVGAKNFNLAAEEFKIHPNPAIDSFFVQYSSVSAMNKNIQIELYAMSGVKVKEKELISVSGRTHTSQIDTHDLRPGIYTVKLIVDGNIVSAKLLVINQE